MVLGHPAKMEFEKVRINKNLYYWTWKDFPFFSYGWLEEKDLKNLPTPFLLIEIDPKCRLGFDMEESDEVTNIIKLEDNFEKLKIDNDLRKDLKRVEKKNEELRLVYNEEGSLERSKQWFLDLWKEGKRDFKRRLEIWKENCQTTSAYLGEELIAVHITMKEKDTVYYMGCWWNREYKALSTPTFLLKKDIEKAIAEGMKYYDLGIGDEPYKKKWGVIEKPSKYYAIIPQKLADWFKMKNYVLSEEESAPTRN
jgi:hypothetical protein